MNRFATAITIATIIGIVAVNADVMTNLSERVRSTLDALERDASPMDLDEGNIMSGFELRFADAYLPVVSLMSNHWQEVIMSLDEYATNRVERLVLVNTGWWYGDEEYLGYLSLLADKVMSNQFSMAEFNSFFGSSWSSGRSVASVFARRHNEAAVSNLINKIQSFFPASGYWQKVRSGEALEEYLDAVSP